MPATPSQVPNYEQRGRPYSQVTRLGRVMWLRGWQEAYKLAGKMEISPRQMTEYLAGREPISMPHLVKLAEELDVNPPELLLEPNQPKEEGK